MKYIYIITIITTILSPKTLVYNSLKEFCYDNPNTSVCLDKNLENITENVSGCKPNSDGSGYTCYSESYQVIVKPEKKIKKNKKQFSIDSSKDLKKMIQKLIQENGKMKEPKLENSIEHKGIVKSNILKNRESNIKLKTQNFKKSMKESKISQKVNAEKNDSKKRMIVKKLTKEDDKNIFKMTSPLVVQELARENRNYSYDAKPYLYSNIETKERSKKDLIDLRLYDGNQRIKQKVNIKKDIYCNKYKFNIYSCNRENQRMYNTITKEPFSGIHYERNANNDIWFTIKYEKGQRVKIKWYIYYSKHLLKSEGIYSSKTDRSILTSYYKNQFLKSIEQYTKGSRDGIIKQYYSNGQIAKRLEYKENKKDGTVKTYYRNGSLNSVTEYVKGIKSGEERIYYENAIVALINHYKDGTPNGKATKYDKYGKIVAKAYFKKGMLHGLYNLYYKNGNIKYEVTFRNNREEGLARGYFTNGNLQKEINYKGGEKQGLSRVYYSNGKIHMEVLFRNDKIVSGYRYKLAGKKDVLTNAEISNYNSKLKRFF